MNNINGNSNLGFFRMEHTMYAGLADKLIDLRTKENLSQQQLADNMGVPFEIVKQLENVDIVSLGIFGLAFQTLGINLGITVIPSSKGRGKHINE